MLSIHEVMLLGPSNQRKPLKSWRWTTNKNDLWSGFRKKLNIEWYIASNDGRWAIFEGFLALSQIGGVSVLSSSAAGNHNQSCLCPAAYHGNASWRHSNFSQSSSDCITTSSSSFSFPRASEDDVTQNILAPVPLHPPHSTSLSFPRGKLAGFWTEKVRHA